ncbi:hypothetical protein ACQKFO_21555 [Rossellomorea sp. NPDC071047]|uniref:hypothetical protein n=1 Tax=Rossellomorea sp. NPDC071047 TaxID=3390675 RepID=UPI003CFD5718
MGYYDDTHNGSIAKTAMKKRKSVENRLLYKDIKPSLIKAALFISMGLVLLVSDRVNPDYSFIVFAIVVAFICIFYIMYFCFEILKKL